MSCFFCSSSEHLPENCNIYPTLESRYSKTGYSSGKCFCRIMDNSSCLDSNISKRNCSCYNFCDVCLQAHHTAFCPKKDPNHSLFSKDFPDPINFFKLDYLIIKRFLTLSNPIDKIKLHLTCKYMGQLQPLEYKLRHFNCYSENLYSNVIYTGNGTNLYDDIEVLNAKNTVFNLENFAFIFEKITKVNWEIVTKSNPILVEFECCVLGNDLPFCDFIDAIPYTVELSFNVFEIPPTWFKDLCNAKRYVSFQKIDIFSPDVFPEMNANELIKLFKVNPKLKLYFSLCLLDDAKSKIEETMNHKMFSITDDEDDWSIRFEFGRFRIVVMKYKINLMDN